MDKNNKKKFLTKEQYLEYIYKKESKNEDYSSIELIIVYSLLKSYLNDKIVHMRKQIEKCFETENDISKTILKILKCIKNVPNWFYNPLYFIVYKNRDRLKKLFMRYYNSIKLRDFEFHCNIGRSDIYFEFPHRNHLSYNYDNFENLVWDREIGFFDIIIKLQLNTEIVDKNASDTDKTVGGGFPGKYDEGVYKNIDYIITFNGEKQIYKYLNDLAFRGTVLPREIEMKIKGYNINDDIFIKKELLVATLCIYPGNFRHTYKTQKDVGPKNITDTKIKDDINRLTSLENKKVLIREVIVESNYLNLNMGEYFNQTYFTSYFDPKKFDFGRDTDISTAGGGFRIQNNLYFHNQTFNPDIFS